MYKNITNLKLGHSQKIICIIGGYTITKIIKVKIFFLNPYVVHILMILNAYLHVYIDKF